MLNEMYELQNITYTENGSKAYRSTGSECLDFFAAVGALRSTQESRLKELFIRAFAENPDYALRIAFFARDIRAGLGERGAFRIIVQYLAQVRPESLIKSLSLFPEYGRFDDLLALLETPCETAVCAYIRTQLAADEAGMKTQKSVSLLAKWLPSVNTSSASTRKSAKRLCKCLKLTESEYRKRVSALRSYLDVLEKRLCVKDYSFDYEKQPGGAMFKYRKAFYRNDRRRYSGYISALRSGEKQLHAETLYPYEIVSEVQKGYLHLQEREVLDMTWKALPDFTDSRNAIVVVDGSGSMYYNQEIPPIAIAVSLGLYFAEHNTGYFRNHFITFSETPKLVQVKGSDIYARTKYCMSYNEVANTDLYQVFMLLLITAVKKKLPQSELPEMIYIISDMEFDVGVNRDKTVFEDAKEKFEDYGYRLPRVVYWNVAARNQQYPVTKNENGVALVSGASPSLFRFVMSKETTPESFMESVLLSDRYKNIYA